MHIEPGQIWEVMAPGLGPYEVGTRFIIWNYYRTKYGDHYVAIDGGDSYYYQIYIEGGVRWLDLDSIRRYCILVNN